MDQAELRALLADDLRRRESASIGIDVLFSEELGERDSVVGALRVSGSEMDAHFAPEPIAAEILVHLAATDGEGYVPPAFSADIRRNTLSWGAEGDSWKVVMWVAEAVAAGAVYATYEDLYRRFRPRNRPAGAALALTGSQMDEVVEEAAWFVEETLVEDTDRWDGTSSALDNMTLVGTQALSDRVIVQFHREGRDIEVEIMDPSEWRTIARWAWADARSPSHDEGQAI